MMMVQIGNHHDPRRIEELKQLIDDESYLSGAIQRLAQILSNEILDLSNAGAFHERKR